MAKEKQKAPASFLNEDKTLVQIKDIVNIQKIYFEMQRRVGTPKDSFESALKNKGFVVEVDKNKNVDIRYINTSIYFAEMDLAKENFQKAELRTALKGGTPENIQDKKIRYGLAIFLNRESMNPQRFEDDLAKRFDYYCKVNAEKPNDIEFYKNQIAEESNAFQETYKLLEKAGIAKTSEKGSMYLENLNTFKKVELVNLIGSPYADINESTLKKAMTIAGEKKAISDEVYAKKEVVKEEATTSQAQEAENTSQEEKEAPKKRAKKSTK